MARRKSHSARRKWGFKILPCELRHQILEHLRKQAGGTKRILSAWAHVSREWQRFFEPDIFERLSLQVPGPDIRQLKYVVVNGRQKLVRKISLHVHLAWHSKQEENEFEDEFTKNANTKALSGALLNLFSVLSGWKQDASAQGLAFELSATSPSYYLHQEGRRYRTELQLRASKQRLLGALLDIRFNSPSVSIPSVPIITSFSMNQRSHRKLSASALAMLLACMPCLRDVNYQPVWVGLSFADHDSERKRECDARNLAISTLFRSVYMSPSLQDLSLWEAQYDDHPIYQRTVPECLVSVAVLASYRLRNFTISNVIDAAQFFKCHESMTQDSSGSLSYPYWPNLMYLCLTTERGMDNLGDLLERAAGAARQMPKLRIMEVWCPKVDTQGPMSFFFRYDVRKTDTRLTVSVTWGISLSERILTAWQRVSNLHSQHKLDYRVKFIDAHYYPWLYKRLRLYNLLRDWGPGIEH
ncbi:hypothetical protein CKAH01_17654 [Colletotrichum kahawae]|uniref:DUF6546 domain-containing protein n=1 Tax=Colletotrichum kahawae TaxID=34407 RepID=A0AAD9YBQ2_COLKA|nr:hypothetical protein CKAH01_17654 [Colletotrichum kahawae]